jgi:hypothetical protein
MLISPVAQEETPFDIAPGPTESCCFACINIPRGRRGPNGNRLEVAGVDVPVLVV